MIVVSTAPVTVTLTEAVAPVFGSVAETPATPTPFPVIWPADPGAFETRTSGLVANQVTVCVTSPVVPSEYVPVAAS
jgi:hypothetical protein